MSHPICAVASSPGRSALCVIRLSGEGVLRILQRVFSPRSHHFSELHKNPRMAILGHLFFEENLIDEVIVIPFVKPHSYTGEEAAEIHTHGNPIIAKKVLGIFYQLGIRQAEPGEFTRRAFLSGKIDLTQAEAIHEIIKAKTEQGVQKALQLKEGSFRKIILNFRSKLMNLLADISAELDFTEEGITFSAKGKKVKEVKDLILESTNLLEESGRLNIFREGIEIVIAGAPNTGKSSLLNFFAGEERAIVSETPGTTRDYIQTVLEIQGVPVHFTDTAGLREIEQKNNSEHTTLEKAGIKKSIQKIKESDLMILMLDGSIPMDTIKKDLPQVSLTKRFQTEKNTPGQSTIENKNILLINKKDALHDSWNAYNKNKLKEILPLEWGSPAHYETAFISIKTGEGLPFLNKILEENISQRTSHTSGVLLSAWQKDILHKIIVELMNTQSLLESDELPEIIVSSLQMVLDELSQLIGEITNEEILGRIFSRFCIGK